MLMEQVKTALPVVEDSTEDLKYTELLGRIEALEKEVEAIKSARGRSTSENESKRAKINAYFDWLERNGGGRADLDGANPYEAQGAFFSYCRMNGVDIDKSRGTRTIFTVEVRKRYGLHNTRKGYSADGD